jgi:glycosyltransferase involved in cell wall biosynthesis
MAPRSDRPARLLIVTPIYPTPDRPEAGAFVWRRVAALREVGVDVEVLSFPSYRGSGLRRYAGLFLRGLRVTRRPDGVEGHVLLYAGLVALLVARLQRRPLILYSHGLDVRETARKSKLHEVVARFVARRAKAVVTNSAATAALVARLGVTAAVVPPGVDFDEFRPRARAETRPQLRLDEHGLVAVYVGGLSRRKGADVFAAALAKLPAWTGVMIGEGPLRNVIRETFPGIRLEGAVPPAEVPAWLAAADVVIVPSREEPLGLAAVEALASGVPVVASAVGGLTEIVRPNVNGLLVEPGDPAALVATLQRLEDEELRRRLGDAARDSVSQHDLRVTTAQMAAIWRAAGVDL